MTHGALQLAVLPTQLDLLPVAMYGRDRQGRLLWYNARAAKLWGRSPPLGESPRFLDGIQSSVESGNGPEQAESQLERPDGSRVWVSLHTDQVKDGGGEIAGTITCLHDCTSHHEELAAAGRKVLTTERKYRDILDALPAAVYTTDAAGRITYYNRAAVELSGHEPKLGSDKWCVTPRLFRTDGSPLPHEECPMAVALKEDRPIRNEEVVAERPDGTRVPILPFPTPLHDASGALAGAVNMLVDISERKTAETRQQILMNELNHRVKNNMQTLHSLLVRAQRQSARGKKCDALSEACRRVAAMAGAQQVLYSGRNNESFTNRDFLEAVCGNIESTLPPEVSIHRVCSSGELANDKAIPLALILSELLTNAVEHGQGTGGAPIRVGLSENMLFVEDRGPGFELKTEPARGSGFELVQGLAKQLGARFEVQRGLGARCELHFARV